MYDSFSFLLHLYFCMLSAVTHHIKSVFHKTSSQTIGVHTAFTVSFLLIVAIVPIVCVCVLSHSLYLYLSLFLFFINLVSLSAFLFIIVHVLRYKYNLSSCWLKTLFTIHREHFAQTNIFVDNFKRISVFLRFGAIDSTFSFFFFSFAHPFDSLISLRRLSATLAARFFF